MNNATYDLTDITGFRTNQLTMNWVLMVKNRDPEAQVHFPKIVLSVPKCSKLGWFI